ncbi:uncharacterized protein LOC127836484 [Dreissena polymorpha]|uniref:Uncharacterized protein n=1 Tax=Dreissena polymorpha TaxID=45954 RepID=A0A9D4GD42_DREPO|nr:uncharacterized protein LOC127836484 [Dreissena polymorpha]KAH3813193.1 hypothetical protein DPMN_141645 [Dreissena polymorpha]
MAGEECLSKVAKFLQEGKALRSLWKGTRLEEPKLSDIFTWISHELFRDIELTPIALRHAIQKHHLTGRKDITEVLIDIFTGSGQNENKLEELQNQVLDPQYDKANYVIYFYCLATFIDIDIYVVNSESNNECKWNEYKSLKLLNIKQEIDYRNKMYKFDVNRNKQPGFLMAYMHMDASGLHMYIIRSQSSQPRRPECKGMVELAARQLKSTPLVAITVPPSLVVDVQQNVAQIPEKCKRISLWVEEFWKAV